MEQVLIFLDEWWKPTLQGAVGSAFFWLFLKYAPRIYESVSDKYAQRSLKAKKKLLTYKISKYSALTADGAERATFFAALVYAALREVVKGLVWLTLGLITMSVIPIFSVVGFLGSLYFFIKATTVMSPIDTDIDKNETLKELKAEQKKVIETLNKSSKRDAVTGASS